MNRNPEVQVQMLVADRLVDLVEEGVDLAIRIAQLKDSSLIARKLAPNPRKLVAAPAYLAKWGAPARPEEINDHALITLHTGSPIHASHLFADAHETMIRATCTICPNNGHSILSPALSGACRAIRAAPCVGEPPTACRAQESGG